VPEKASRKLIMKDGSALAGPGLRGTPFRALTLLAEIGEFANGPMDESDALVLDLKGAYVLSGLVDTHVHFDLAAEPVAYRTDPRAGLVRAHLLAQRPPGPESRNHRCSRSGLGGSAGHRLRRSGAAGCPRRPSHRGGRKADHPHRRALGSVRPYGRTASGPIDAWEAVREQVATGARVMKVMASGGPSTPGDPGSPQFTLKELTAAVQEAHKFGLQVAAHPHAAAGVRIALEGGVDTIEHAAFADEATLVLIRQYGRTLVPTVTAEQHHAWRAHPGRHGRKEPRRPTSAPSQSVSWPTYWSRPAAPGMIWLCVNRRSDRARTPHVATLDERKNRQNCRSRYR